MNIHEYQSKAILKSFGAPVSEGQPALTVKEAVSAAKTLPGPVYVVKSQIHAGGRGKGKFKELPSDAKGGVRLAKSVDEVAAHAREMLGHMLITSQTGPAGKQVNRLYIEDGCDIEKEFYLSMLVDRETSRVAFVGTDMAMLEINPLVVTKQGELRCLDAKVSFDSNALYRHSEVVKLRDLTEEDGKEIEASKYDLNYIALAGTIGCMVNGAGLAMATMDIIKLYGATPANFLDVGGGATKEKVAAAFKIITSDPNVKGILVNIFGGIMRCDVVAEGVVAAVREVGLTVPLVVRLEGTNVELGKKIIKSSGLNVVSADDLDDAAQKIVRATRKEAA